MEIHPSKDDHESGVGEEAVFARRAYITSTVWVRLHQRAFKESGLEADRNLREAAAMSRGFRG
jgi:hypothetical protein